MHSASTEPVLAASSGEAIAGANDTASVRATAVAKSVDEARPPGMAKCSAATAATAVTATVAKSVGVGEARPPEVAKCRATTESDLAESSAEASSDEEVPPWPSW